MGKGLSRGMPKPIGTEHPVLGLHRTSGCPCRHNRTPPAPIPVPTRQGSGMTVLVGLQDVPAADRAELWRATASTTFAPLDLRIEQPNRFRGQLRGQELGELV